MSFLGFKKVFVGITLLLGVTTYAGTNSYCGKKTEAEGNAYLTDDKGKDLLELAERGGDRSLLEQANQLLGKGGMKTGESYCLTVMMSPGGSPVKVLKARPDVLAKSRKTVVAPTGTPAKALPDADAKQPQKLHEVKQVVPVGGEADVD